MKYFQDIHASTAEPRRRARLDFRLGIRSHWWGGRLTGEWVGELPKGTAHCEPPKIC